MVDNDPADDAHFYHELVTQLHQHLLIVLDRYRQVLVTPTSPTSGVYLLASALTMLLGELLRELAVQDQERGPQRCREMIDQLRLYVAEETTTTRVQ